ncbi:MULTISPECIES: amidohydrolase family protein [unclassified Acinetobacter]|uniref:amidohydrolase family protein n=1 Tax=unclassified Acinetobacter TaxID=196816 RepID=UPI002091A8CF|nr:MULTISPECIES: amidohydrolase family protein [unclassified Acinetobacter]
MNTAKFSVHQLQTERLLLLPSYILLKEGLAQGQAILIENGVFQDIGTHIELTERYPDIAPVKLPEQLIMPGMIDGHHHLTQSFAKSLAYGEPSEIFKRIWVPLESNLDENFVYLCTKLAALESLRGGFTTVCDAGTRSESSMHLMAGALEETGLRCVLSLICNDGRELSTSAKRQNILRNAQNYIETYQQHKTIHPSLAISIPEVASDEMLYEVSKLCADNNIIFQVHVNEHLASVERSIIQQGMRPLEHLANVGALGPQTLIAHATMLTPSELLMLQRTNTAVSYNPVASQWKGNAVASAQLMHELNIRFALGTDATRPDGFRLLDAAEATQKLIFGIPTGDCSTGGGWMWLDHATTAGADAVGLSQLTGSISIGKQADFLLIDLDTPEFCTSQDITWDMVRLCQRDQFQAVFVGGQMRLWQGWPVDWDAKALMRQMTVLTQKAIAASLI